MATALATAPSVLILDEPTFGQDRRTAGELLDLLAALRDSVVPSPLSPTTATSPPPWPIARCAWHRPR